MPVQTFQQAYATCDVARQAEIERFWLVNAEPDEERRLMSMLKRMQNPAATRFCFELLATHERLLLFHVLKRAHEGIPANTLLKKTRLEPPEMQAALEHLSFLLLIQQAMIHRPIPIQRRTRIILGEQAPQEEMQFFFPSHEQGVCLSVIAREQFGSADRSQFPLARIIREIPHHALYMLAQHHLIDLSRCYGVTEQRTLIIEELSQPETILQTVERMQAKLQKFFRWLMDQGGTVTLPKVRECYTDDDNTLLSLIQTLADYALAFTTFNTAGEHLLFIPQEMYQSLHTSASRPKEAETEYSLIPLDEPPTAQCEGVPILLFDIAVVIGMAHQQEIAPRSDGHLPKRILTKIRPLLQGEPRQSGESEDIYPDQILDLMKTLKLLALPQPVEGGEKTTYQPGPELVSWASMSVVAQGRCILDWWMTNSRYRDGWENDFGQWSTSFSPLRARKILIDSLKRCIPGRWYTISGLLQTLWKEEPFSLSTNRDAHSPIRLPPSHSQRSLWYKREAIVYRGSLATLHELGIISFGQRESSSTAHAPSHPDTFSLTTLGQAIIEYVKESRSQKTHTARDRVVVTQPSFELIVLAFDPISLYRLLPFAQVQHISQTSRLQITRDSVVRGASLGLSSEQMLSQLTSVSKTDIPQNVAYSIREWARGYKSIRFSQVLLLEVSEGELFASELDRHPLLAPFQLRLLGPRHLCAPNHVNVSALQRTLKELGIITRIDGNIRTLK